MINKTKLALGIATALTLTGAMVSSDAMAHPKKAKMHTVTESYSSSSSSTTSSSKMDAMEAQLKAMQDEIRSLRAAGRPSADTGKVQELDQWMSDVKTGKAKVEAPKDHLFSVRGGWMHFNDNRDGNSATLPVLNSTTFSADRDAHYYGGAVDFNMNNNLFGLMDHTSFGIEFGLEYAQLGYNKPNGIGNGAGVGSQTANVNQLRISASPKIKFMHGSKLRPWLIPAGLDINIISPPSAAITVMDTGMQFGTGLDYELLKGIVIGADGRYHKSFNSIDGVNTDGFTLGGSVGFKW